MRPLADNPVPPTELEVLGDAINEFAFTCLLITHLSGFLLRLASISTHCNVVG